MADQLNYYKQKLKHLKIPFLPQYNSYTSDEFDQLIQSHNNNHQNQNKSDNIINTQTSAKTNLTNSISSQNSNYNNTRTFNNRKMNSALKGTLAEPLSTTLMRNILIERRKEKRNIIFDSDFKNRVISTIPDDYKEIFNGITGDNPGFSFIYDLVHVHGVNQKITYNRRHFLYLKFGLFKPSHDGNAIQKIIKKTHFIKHFNAVYEFKFNNMSIYFSYFYFYFIQSVKIDESLNSWFIFNTYSKDKIDNIFAGNYSNKNMIFFNCEYQEKQDKLKDKDFFKFSSIRNTFLLTKIDFDSYFKRKEAWYKEGYKQKFDEDDDE